MTLSYATPPSFQPALCRKCKRTTTHGKLLVRIKRPLFGILVLCPECAARRQRIRAAIVLTVLFIPSGAYFAANLLNHVDPGVRFYGSMFLVWLVALAIPLIHIMLMALTSLIVGLRVYSVRIGWGWQLFGVRLRRCLLTFSFPPVGGRCVSAPKWEDRSRLRLAVLCASVPAFDLAILAMLLLVAPRAYFTSAGWPDDESFWVFFAILALVLLASCYPRDVKTHAGPAWTFGKALLDLARRENSPDRWKKFGCASEIYFALYAGDASTARLWLERYAQLESEATTVLLSELAILCLERQWELAKEKAEQAYLATQDPTVQPHFGTFAAAAAFFSGKYIPRAQELCDEVARVAPWLTLLYILQADLAMCQGQIDLAEKAMKQASGNTQSWVVDAAYAQARVRLSQLRIRPGQTRKWQARAERIDPTGVFRPVLIDRS